MEVSEQTIIGVLGIVGKAGIIGITEIGGTGGFTGMGGITGCSEAYLKRGSNQIPGTQCGNLVILSHDSVTYVL